MTRWERAKKWWLGLKRDERDIFALMIFAVIVIPLQALQPPEWVLYILLGLFGVYVVLSSPKVKDEDREREIARALEKLNKHKGKNGVLEKALAETHRQLNPVKGVEALDEHFKKHPSKISKIKNKQRKKRK